MKERIRQIMESVQLSQQDFAARLNISPASLSSIFTGRTNPTNNHVMAIHRAFPDVNISWLMFGEGTMLAESLITSPDPVSELSSDSPALECNKNTDDHINVNSSYPEDTIVRGSQEQPTHGMGMANPERLGTVPSYNASSFMGNAEFLARAKMFERKERKIKEIRVFYDDGTYESFAPSNK